MTQQDPKRVATSGNQAADLLRESSTSEKSLFRVLAETAPASIFIWRGTRFYFVNTAMEKNSGYSTHELLGMNFWDLIHPDYRDFIKELGLARVRGEQVPSRYETKILTKDGVERWIDLANSVIDFEGEPAVLGVGFDITERKLTEVALRNSEARIRTTLENSPVCNKVIDLNSKLLYMSDAGVNRLKIPDIKPFYGCDYPPTFYPDSMRIPLIEHLERAIAGEVSSVECPVLDMEGGEVWYHTTFVPARDNEGQIVHIVATSVDITERKQAEQKLRQAHDELESQVQERTKELKNQQLAALSLAEDAQEARDKLARVNQALEQSNVDLQELANTLAREQYLLNSLVENIPDPIFFKDVEGRFIRANQAMAYDAGFQHPDELLGKTDADIWAGDLPAETQEDERRILETGEPLVNKEEQPTVPGGDSRWVLVTKMALRNKANKIVGTFGVARIITERKRMEEKQRQLYEELSTANEALEESNMELQQFAYIASHDLQTPLRSIAAFAQFLQKDYQGRLDEQADDYIDRMVGSVKSMQTMINDLLAYSRVESRSVPFQRVDLSQVCDDAAVLLRASIEDAEGEVTHKKLPIVMGDRSQLTQLLQNLIGNGIKYHGDNPPRVHVSAENIGDAWTIAVHDNGIGIGEKYYDQIFEIFRRLHTEQIYPGTGIGLAICRRIIHRHDGRIWLESEPGKGSTFYFTIPEGTPKET